MAGLIPQSFIDELLNRVDIVEVIDRHVTLKKSGKNYQACCPFHQEKTPSFSVNPERQFFHCFGCRESGNAVGFLMKFQNLGFPEAVESLARDAGMEVPRQESPAQARRGAEQRELYECLKQASDYYRAQLRKHPQRERAVSWCKSRGIDGATAREFQLGYAPPGWENLLGALGVDEKARGRLLRAGLAIARERAGEDAAGKSSLYDRFRDRVVFPIRDARGRTVGFGGRVLGEGEPKYLNSPETPVFQKGNELYGFYEARKSRSVAGRLLLVEGYMDVIALAQAGIRNAVATLGTATGTTQIQRMFRQVPEIVFCFDGDDAGRRAAWRALETCLPLLADGKSARFLFLPEGEDPDSMVRKQGSESFLALVDKAKPLETFFFEHLAEDLDTELGEGRAALSSRAMPLIRKLPENVFRHLMIDKLAEIAGVDSKTLLKLQPQPAARRPARAGEPPPWLEEPAGQDTYPGLAQSAPFPPEPGRPRALRGGGSPLSSSLVAIKLLLRVPEVALDAPADVPVASEAATESENLLLELVEKVRGNPDIDYSSLLEHCYRSELIRGQLTSVITGENIEPADKDKVRSEFFEILDELIAKRAKMLSNRQRRDQLHALTAAKLKTGE